MSMRLLFLGLIQIVGCFFIGFVFKIIYLHVLLMCEESLEEYLNR